MANYSLVIGSKFKPFSYQELLHPALMATQAHQDIEEQYAELATKANIWDEMANEQTDPYAYKMYKTYSNDLEEKADQLAREGLNPTSRQSLLKMKQRYSSDIVPIEQAYKRRQELIDEQRKLSAQDNTLMFDRSASMLSLDDLIKNPQLTYKSYSGATLAKQVGTAALNLAKEMRSNPRKWNSILHGQYFETMMQKGYRPEEVLLASIGDPTAPKELRDIVESAVDSSGIRNWNNIEALHRAYDYARQGVWNAIGETQYQTLQNQEYLNPIQRLQKKALEKELNNTNNNSDKHYRSIANTTVEGDKKTSEMQSDMEFLAEIASNYKLLESKGKRYIPSQISPTGIEVIKGRTEDYNPNLERLKNISKKYNLDLGYTIYTEENGTINYDNKKLIEGIYNLQDQISKSAIRNNSYILDITDASLVSQTLRENIASYNSRTGHTGIYEVDKNTKGDEVEYTDAIKYLKGDVMMEFDPKLKAFKAVGTVYNGDTPESKSFILDPEIIVGETVIDIHDGKRRNIYQAQIDAIDRDIEANNYEGQKNKIHYLMNDLYSRYNSKSKRQSLTLSKDEENGK